jgi:hypothetical protein
MRHSLRSLRRQGISVIQVGSHNEKYFFLQGIPDLHLALMGSVPSGMTVKFKILLPGGTDRRFAKFSMTGKWLFQSIIHVI